MKKDIEWTYIYVLYSMLKGHWKEYGGKKQLKTKDRICIADI
jgi:hypothetical protein